MTTDQPLDLDAIETAADAATPGPWTAWAESYPHLVLQGPQDVHPSDAEGVISTNLAVNEVADAAYIAAMPPEVAKRLVAEVRRLRDQVAGGRAQIADEVIEWSGQQIGVHVPTVDAIADMLRAAAGSAAANEEQR